MVQKCAKMIENFRSLLDFQGVSEVLGKKVKAKIEKVEESDMIWNIFDDAKLRNIENELGSQLTIIDSHAVGVTRLTCDFADRGIIEQSRHLEYDTSSRKNSLGEPGPFYSLEVIEIWQGMTLYYRGWDFCDLREYDDVYILMNAKAWSCRNKLTRYHDFLWLLASIPIMLCLSDYTMNIH